MLQFVAGNNPVHRIAGPLRSALIDAQGELIDKAFVDAWALLSTALSDCRINATPDDSLRDVSAATFADQSLPQLLSDCEKLLVAAGLPPQVVVRQKSVLAERVQLIRAFKSPDAVVQQIADKTEEVIQGFPSALADIERGKNPGDVLDPYILAATVILLYGGEFEPAITATVSHKALMKIEDLMGGLHQEVIGRMRGNVRVPEPAGMNKEMIDLEYNPFPGADIVQPPFSPGDRLRFHQVKSKTGSAKGGDGKRLGDQLRSLQQYYDGEIYYDALVGNTLRGHRSKGGAEKAAPGLVVLVGQAAFQALTSCDLGPTLLMRLYQAAFAVASDRTGYRAEVVAGQIFEEFEHAAGGMGDSLYTALLPDVIGGPLRLQDSRLFNALTSKEKRGEG